MTGYEETHGAANSAPQWTWKEFWAELRKERKVIVRNVPKRK